MQLDEFETFNSTPQPSTPSSTSSASNAGLVGPERWNRVLYETYEGLLHDILTADPPLRGTYGALDRR